MFDLKVDYEFPRIEEREFDFPESASEAEELFEWLDSGNRAAVINTVGEKRIVAVPVASYNRLDDISLRSAYMPHWELDGFAVEDMPVVRDLLWAADEGLLVECLREVLSDAPSPSGVADVEGAIKTVLLFFNSLKTFDFDSCDDCPRVVMPLVVYRNGTNLGQALSSMEAVVLSMAEVLRKKPSVIGGKADYSWHRALGYKVWFGGLSIRDAYRALAWLVCKLLRDSFVDHGIWFGDLPPAEESDYVKQLNEGALLDLQDRMAILADRIVPLEDLETITFEVDEDDYKQFEALCRESGLSVQNALHIAIRRFVDSMRE